MFLQNLVILRETVAELFDSLADRIRYVIAFCSQLEAASDVISGSFEADCPW